jgi:flotillin
MEQTVSALSGFQIGLIIGIAILVLLGIIFAIGYVKAPPDTAFVISGIRKQPRFLIGRAGVRIPFLEQKDELMLKAIKVDVNTSDEIPTADFINITVDANVNVQVDTELEKKEEERSGLLQRAARNFLNLDQKSIVSLVQPVLEGNVREIVGKMYLKDMVNDRQKFSTLVSENVKPDLSAMGLKLVSFNVQNFKDKEGTIRNMGIDNIEAIRKDAEIAKSNAQRDIRIAKAEADNEASIAEVKSKTAVAERETELAIKKADLKKKSDIQEAIADAAKGIEAANQKKTLNITEAEAETAKQMKLIEVRQEEANVTEKELIAKVIRPAEAAKQATIIKAEGEQKAKLIAAETNLETTKKNADAEKYQEERKAEVKLFNEQKDAEAERYKQEQNAEGVKAMADADLKTALAKAQGVEANGKAEAAAIEAKGLAEAEAKDKMADAMAKFGDAAKQDLTLETVKAFVAVLPDVAGNITKHFEKVGNYTIYGEGGGAKLGGDATQAMSQIIASVKDATGLDAAGILNSFLGSRTALAVADKANKA